MGFSGWLPLAACSNSNNSWLLGSRQPCKHLQRHSTSPHTLQRPHIQGPKNQCDHHQAVTSTVLHASMNTHPSYLITVMSRISSPSEVACSLAQCTVTTPSMPRSCTARLLLCVWASISTALVTSGCTSWRAVKRALRRVCRASNCLSSKRMATSWPRRPFLRALQHSDRLCVLHRAEQGH